MGTAVNTVIRRKKRIPPKKYPSAPQNIYQQPKQSPNTAIKKKPNKSNNCLKLVYSSPQISKQFVDLTRKLFHEFQMYNKFSYNLNQGHFLTSLKLWGFFANNVFLACLTYVSHCSFHFGQTGQESLAANRDSGSK